MKILLASDGTAHDAFGVSVAISGNTVIVGANGDSDNGPASGSTYIFDRNQGGANNWGQVAKLGASPPVASHQFGLIVAISGDRAIVGAPGDPPEAYIFDRNQGGPNNWGQVKKFVGGPGVYGFAVSVAIRRRHGPRGRVSRHCHL